MQNLIMKNVHNWRICWVFIQYNKFRGDDSFI
jgi:hypothetical protein